MSPRRRPPSTMWACRRALVFLVALAWRAPAQTSPHWPSPSAVQLIAVGPAGYEKTQECSGTALWLDAQGDLLTNAHVVELAQRCLEGRRKAQLLVKFSNSSAPEATAIPCRVTELDKRRDLALLRADWSPGFKPPWPRWDENPLPRGTRLRVAGFPASSWQPVIQTGFVIGYQFERLLRGRPDATQMLVMKVSLRRGSSGSPVYLADGRLVGLVEARLSHDPTEALIIPARYIANFLRRSAVVHGTPTSHSR